MGVVLAAIRALVILLATSVQLAGLLMAQTLVPSRRECLANAFRRHWAYMTCAVLGLRLTVQGTLPSGPLLFIANHRSWADAPVLLALLRCTLLSKAEVMDYPVIGFGAQAVGIAFVHRVSIRSRGAALGGLRHALTSGGRVGVFAEGTTSAWGQLRPLELGPFRLAAEGHNLMPVAIAYERPADSWADESLAEHYFRCMGRWSQRVQVSIGPTLQGTDPHELRRLASEWLRATLDQLEPAAQPQPAGSRVANR